MQPTSVLKGLLHGAMSVSSQPEMNSVYSQFRIFSAPAWPSLFADGLITQTQMKLFCEKIKDALPLISGF